VARFVILSFNDHGKAEEFMRDISLGRIIAWEHGKREGFKVEATPLAIVKPSTISNRPLRAEDFWNGDPTAISDKEDENWYPMHRHAGALAHSHHKDNGGHGSHNGVPLVTRTKAQNPNDGANLDPYPAGGTGG
jgi:hypothetical protein